MEQDKKEIKLSMFDWIDALVSLDKPSNDLKLFLDACENARPDPKVLALKKITKGQFCEDRVELALNILLDNKMIKRYERFAQHSKEDSAGYDFTFTVNYNDEDYKIALDAKAGGSNNKHGHPQIRDVKHKTMPGILKDFYLLFEEIKKQPNQYSLKD